MSPWGDVQYKAAVAPSSWQGGDPEVGQGGRDRWHSPCGAGAGGRWLSPWWGGDPAQSQTVIGVSEKWQISGSWGQGGDTASGEGAHLEAGR